MSTLTALARAQARAAGVAQPVATVRHLHLSARPLVLIPLTLAGEANAPLAALVGTDPDEPRLMIVPQPRNRAQRFAFAAALAAVILPYVAEHRGVSEAVAVDRGRDVRYRYVNAPQLLVPNPGGIDFVRLFGRATRFRRTDGDHPVPPEVPLLGRWLTWFAERAEHPGSAALVAMTDALTLHWATGQSALEDAHLAALLGWIEPPPGRDGAQAAAEAEDPAVWPPAGPTTDPEFDNERLAQAISAYQEVADDPAAEPAAYAELADLLRGQLTPTWHLMWRGVELLRGLPPGQRVVDRWAEDRDAFTDHATYVDSGAPPQPRQDAAVSAAQRLHRMERALASYAVQRAYDDPLVMAGYRLTGEAFVAEVVLADPRRVDDRGRRPVLRPRIMLRTTDPVLVNPGVTLVSPARPAQRAKVVSVGPAGPVAGSAQVTDLATGSAQVTGPAAGSAQVTGPAAGITELVLELSGGMGRTLTAPPGSVPGVGERLCYTTLVDTYIPPGWFPAREETPWTHGGPPGDETLPASVAPADGD